MKFLSFGLIFLFISLAEPTEIADDENDTDDRHTDLICSMCGATGYTKEPGCDYPGNDLMNVHATTFEECRGRCARWPDCKVFMHNIPGKICYLKARIGGRSCINPANTAGRRCQLVPECKEQNAYALLTTGNAKGGVSFTYDYYQRCMKIYGTIRNLSPGFHGFHIHALGDLREGCTSAASHYNPEHVDHAGPRNTKHHAGDLGNILANDRGVAEVNMCFDFVHTRGAQSVLGRSVVVHEKRDDLGSRGDTGSKTTGNAGSRVGCGVIGLTK